MAFENLSDEELDQQIAELEAMGADQSLGGPPIFIKALLTDALQLPSRQLLGATAYTPGHGKFDNLLLDMSQQLDDWTNPNWERDVQMAASQGLGSGQFWGAVLGQQANLMANMATLGVIGQGVGKVMALPFAAGAGAAGTAASAPTGPGAPAVGAAAATGVAATLPKVMGAAFSMGGLVLGETGTFLEQAQYNGIDRDVAERVARPSSILTGAVEYAQQIGRIGPLKGAMSKWVSALSKKGASKAGTEMAKATGGRLSVSLLKWAGTELGINLSEGLEEIAQEGIQGLAMKRAVTMMKERYGEDWSPTNPLAKPDYIKAGAVGFVAGGVMRGAGYTVGVPAGKIQDFKLMRKISDELGSDTLDLIIEEGKRIKKGESAKLTLADLTVHKEGKIHLTPPGLKSRFARIAEGLSDPDKVRLINMMNKGSIETLHRGMGLVGVYESLRDLYGRPYPTAFKKGEWYHSPSLAKEYEAEVRKVHPERGEGLILAEEPSRSRVMFTRTKTDIQRIAVPAKPNIVSLGDTLLTAENVKPHFDAGADIVSGRGDFAVNPTLTRTPIPSTTKSAPKTRKRKGIRVGHASPHTWAPESGYPRGRPRLDRVGTGEGSAMFGYGLYLAESGEVQHKYRTGFADREALEIRNLPESEYQSEGALSARGQSVHNFVRNQILRGMTLKEALDSAREYYSRKVGAQAEVEFIDKYRKNFVFNEPSLYDFVIPEDVLPRLLDWDHRISQDHENAIIRQASREGGVVESNVKTAIENSHKDGSESMFGLSLYFHLENMLGSNKAASEFLARAGIPGNKYLDQGSRTDRIYPPILVPGGSGMWQSGLGDKLSPMFETEKEAKTWLDSEVSKGLPKKTYNFVIWDQPTLDQMARPVKPPQLPKTWKDKRTEILNNLGLIKEGVRPDGEGGLILEQPVLNHATEHDARWVRAVESAAISNARVIVEARMQQRMDEGKIPEPPQNKNDLAEWTRLHRKRIMAETQAVMWELRQHALTKAGLDDLTSRSEEMNAIDPNNRKKAQENRFKFIDRQKYIKFGQAMESEMRAMVRENLGKRAEAALDAAIYGRYTLAPVLDKNLKESQLVGEMEDQSKLSLLFHRMRPFLPMFAKIQNQNPLLRFLDFDHAMSVQLKRLHEMSIRLDLSRKKLYRSVDKRFLRGRNRRLFNDVIFRMSLTDPKEIKWFNEQMEMTNPLTGKPRTTATVDDYLDKMIREGKVEIKKGETREQVKERIRAQAMEVGALYEGYFDWFFRETGMDWKMYRLHYLPLVRRWDGTTLWETHLAENRDQLKERGLTERDLDRFLELGDTGAGLRKRGYRLIEKSPFYTFQREQDIDILRKQKAMRETDMEELLQIYQSKLLRQSVFGDMVPTMAAFMDKAAREMAKQGAEPEDVRVMIANYVEATLGIPGVSQSALKKVNLVSDTGAVGRTLGSLVKAWNKRYGHVKEFQEFYSLEDAASSLTTIVYAATLGLPFNMTSPIKNVMTQNVMAGLLGARTYLTGLARLDDPKIRAKINKGNFRSEFPMEFDDDFSGRGAVRRGARALLYLYKMSDHVNVLSAASGAFVAWERIEAYQKKDPGFKSLTIDEMYQMLFDGKSPEKLGLTEEVMTREPIAHADEWHYTKAKGFRGISTELFERLKNGEVADAERFFVQFMVNLTQWRYGRGGSPAFLRNSLWRMVAMYTTWPLNYTELLTMVGNPKNGLLKKALGVAFAQMFLASIVVGLGLPMWKWIGMGPFPEEVGLTGPIVSGVNEILGAIKAGGDVGMTNVIPTVPEAEKAAARQLLEARIRDLYQ